MLPALAIVIPAFAGMTNVRPGPASRALRGCQPSGTFSGGDSRASAGTRRHLASRLSVRYLAAMGSTNSVTQWLERWQAGEPAALDRLLPLVHADLRRIAAVC